MKFKKEFGEVQFKDVEFLKNYIMKLIPNSLSGNKVG